MINISTVVFFNLENPIIAICLVMYMIKTTVYNCVCVKQNLSVIDSNLFSFVHHVKPIIY